MELMEDKRISCGFKDIMIRNCVGSADYKRWSVGGIL
jgi:hypothetical protein